MIFSPTSHPVSIYGGRAQGRGGQRIQEYATSLSLRAIADGVAISFLLLCRSGAYAPCAYPRICSNCASACFHILGFIARERRDRGDPVDNKVARIRVRTLLTGLLRCARNDKYDEIHITWSLWSIHAMTNSATLSSPPLEGCRAAAGWSEKPRQCHIFVIASVTWQSLFCCCVARALMRPVRILVFVQTALALVFTYSDSLRAIADGVAIQ